MFHGTSKIINHSEIDNELRETFLEHNFFKGPHYRTNYFDYNNPENDFDRAVLRLLNNEEFNYKGFKIEYWFQDKNAGTALPPHCDYNEYIRKMGVNEPADWVHTIEKELLMSPITLAVYLEVSNDLIGGELVISEQTWFDIETPLTLTEEDMNLIRSKASTVYKPVQGEILYFYGSSNYHWINEVVQGNRKSMLINFWPHSAVLQLVCSQVKCQ